MRPEVIFGISPRFRRLSQSAGQVTHVLLTRSPLEHPRKGLSARLACVKHAASVRPEPGSNSPTKTSREKTSRQKICQRNPKPSKKNHGAKRTPWHGRCADVGRGGAHRSRATPKIGRQTSKSGARRSGGRATGAAGTS